MASSKQKTAAKKNISKAATAAKKKRTISHLPEVSANCAGEKRRSRRSQEKKSRLAQGLSGES